MKVIVVIFLIAVCLQSVLACHLGREYLNYIRQSLRRRNSWNSEDDDSPYPINPFDRPSPRYRNGGDFDYGDDIDIDGDFENSNDVDDAGGRGGRRNGRNGGRIGERVDDVGATGGNRGRINDENRSDRRKDNVDDGRNNESSNTGRDDQSQNSQQQQLMN